jgi:hypothetical protein
MRLRDFALFLRDFWAGVAEKEASTLSFAGQKAKYANKKIVCAWGAHIKRLREYLQAEWAKQHQQPVPEEVFPGWLSQKSAIASGGTAERLIAEGAQLFAPRVRK